MRLTPILALLIASTAAHAEYGDVRVSDVVRNYDGDTITVNIDNWPDVIGDEISVRVRGVDTPEIRGSCKSEKRQAREAKEFVKETLADADQVVLKDIDRDKFFRIGATVMVDDRDLSKMILERDLGREYDGGTREGWCE